MATPEEPEQQLKYLKFVREAVIQATSYVVTIYEFAKDSSGPLKPGVDSVEGTVKTVVGPVIRQFHLKPDEILLFVDGKVDATMSLLDDVVPQFLKDKSHQAFDVAKQAPDAAKVVYTDFKELGFYETAKSYYIKFEPVAEEWSYKTWKKVLTLPYVPQVVHVVAPPALYGADKLNNVVLALKERRLPFSHYIPLLPVEKMERAILVEASS